MTPQKRCGATHPADGGPRKNDRLGGAIYPKNTTAGVAAQAIRTELIGDDICSAEGIAARGGAPVLVLCRRLVATGYDPAAPLDAYRGATLALRVRSIGEAARLRIATHGIGFERLPNAQGPRRFIKSTGPLRQHFRASAPTRGAR
jgi:hypothetical protein